jgi:phosphatidylserine decarboxylase
MSQPRETHSLLDTIGNAFVPVHRDGYKFVAGAALATLVLFMISAPLGWLGAIATAYCAYFFRDPERVTPSRAGVVVSGADGRVAGVAEGVTVPRELQLGEGPHTRVSVFLSIFDVHIVRAAVAGRIVSSVYVKGAFLNAELDKASEENERRALVIETETGEKIGLVLIAGLVARRIVTFVGEGASVARGERVGLIRFGSRVDVYLPSGARVLVAPGQTAIGGETVLAEFPPQGLGPKAATDGVQVVSSALVQD